MNAKVIHRGWRVKSGDWELGTGAEDHLEMGRSGFVGRPSPRLAVCPWTALSQPAEAYQWLGLWLFHQFGVKPSQQRRGIGTQLMKAAEDHARANGATEIACDTAEGAIHLISLSERKGFRVIGRADFEDTNYLSAILVKKL